MTETLDRAPGPVAPVEPLFVTLPPVPPAFGGPEGAGALEGTRRPEGTGGPDKPFTSAPRRPFHRRHRVALIVMTTIVVILAGGAGVFVYQWNHVGPQQLSASSAYQRFRSGVTGQFSDPGKLRPHEGVYSYTGTAAERLTLPPKSQAEGPKFPGTVTYNSKGCWVLRLDYSNSHWQNSTYCPRNGNLMEVARAGWYRWNLVALSIADTATYTCSRSEVAIPAILHSGATYSFSCTGTNTPLKMGPVTMAGTNEYLGVQTVKIAGTDVVTLHFHEVTHFSGSQTGYNISDTWCSTANGLPVRGWWKTVVTSPTFLGTSTLSGTGDYKLLSLTPRS